MPDLEKYYEYLKSAKADVPPTLESFKKTLSDEVSAKQYYNYLKENKFDAPDTYDSFSNTLGLKKKESTISPLASPSTQETGDVLSESVSGTPESENIPLALQKPILPQTQPIGGLETLPITAGAAEPKKLIQEISKTTSATNQIEGAPFVGTTAEGVPQITPSNIMEVAGKPITIPALRAVTSPQETTAKEQALENPEIKKHGLDLGEKTEALLRGTVSLASSISKTPAFLYDIASAVTNRVINQPFGLNNAPTSTQIGEATGIHNIVAEDLDKAVENSRKRTQEKYDKSISEYLFGDKPEYSKGFSAIGNAIAESLPVTLSFMIGNAAGASNLATIAGGGAVFGAEKMAELEKANPDMSQEQKLTLAYADGLMETVFESKFGLAKLGTLTKDVLKKSGEEAAKEIAERGFKETYSKIFKRYLGISAEEGLSEAATQFSQNALDKFSGYKPDQDLKEGVADSFLVGVASGHTIGAPTVLLQVARTRGARERAHEIIDEKAKLHEDLASPDVTPETKSVVSEKIKNLNNEEATIAQTEKQDHANLSETDKSKVDDLLKESNKIASTLADPNISEPVKEIFKEDLNKIDDQMDEIYEESKKAQEEAAKQEVKDKKVHEDWMGEFEETIKKEKAQESPEIKPKIETDATKKGNIKEGDIVEHPNRDEGGKTTTPSDSDSNVEEIKEEVKPKAEQVQESVTTKKEKDEKAKKTDEAGKKTEVLKEAKEVAQKATPKQELIDEEEQTEAQKKDNPDAIQKLNDDIAVLKGFKDKEVASKKFKAVLERAWKMKEEGKISAPTYTKYRNIAQQVLGPKVNVDAEKAKFHVEQLKEEIKKKLLGEGYKKVLMSAPGFGPKQVADLIDLTAKATQKAIDLGYTVKEAIAKALEHIKKHPNYAKLVSEGHLQEKEFSSAVNKSFEKIEEPVKEKVSGIKKALVSDEIIEGVDLEKISDTEMQETAKKIIDTGEVKPEAVVNEVLKKHRALQPKEVVALIYYKTQLDNDLRTAYDKKSKLIEEGEDTGAVEAEIVALEQKRENFDEVSVITASQQSLAFRLRKGMRDSDFNLVEQIARYKATNNGEISAEVEAKMRDLDKRYREALDKVSELEKKAEEKAIEDAHKNIIEDIDREKGIEKKKTYTQKSKELADKVRRLKSKPIKFTTADGKEIDIQLQGISMNGLIELAAKTIETTGKILDGINAVTKQIKNQDWYKKLSAEDQQAITQQIHDYFTEPEKEIAKPYVNEEGGLVIPHSLIRSIYESGVTDINGIVKAIQEKIEMPVTERQVRDAITRYGKTVNLSKDEIEAGIRQAKRIGKLISQLEDIQKKERPKRSGLQRDKPSDEERRLMKEVKREMKNLPEDPEEDARALKSALDIKKTRLRNRIADLENQLATGEKTPKAKGVELDEEAKDLKERADKLRAELESIEGKPKISDEQRLARMKTYTANRIADLEAKMKAGDFSKTEKPKQISDTELTKARANLMEMRDEWEKLQYENELKNRSKWEKARHQMMGVLNIPRAFKLGFDLSAMGVQGLRRLSTSPVQSAKAFKDMMEQAFSEKAQKEWLKNLKGQVWYPTLKASGAAFTETDGKISVREENFSNDLVKHAFGFLFNKKLGLGKLNPYEASNRAFSGYLNSIRLQGYLEGFKSLERKGKTFESHPQDYKSWVKYINNITGRGSLGKKGNSSELAQFIFTSPRKMISEANLINPWFWSNILSKDKGKDYDYRLTPTVARKAFGDFTLGLGITALAATFARAMFADDDDKKDKDFTDPRSSNFMGVKIKDEHGGFTVVHPFASYKTEIVLLSRLISGEMANTRTGKISPLGKQPMTKGTDLLVSFLSNKLSPTLQIPWKYLKMGEKERKKYNIKEEALKTIEPAALEGFLQTYKDYPAETEAILSLLAFFGLSETHIQKRKAN